MRGYTAIPGGGPFGDEGVSPPPELDPQQEQDDIHIIREKYAGSTPGGGCEDIKFFNLAPGQAIKFDEPTTETNGFILSVDSGTAKAWLGDFTSTPGSKAQFTVPSGGPPPQYVLETRAGRIYTVANDPSAAVNAVGCLTVVRI